MINTFPIEFVRQIIEQTLYEEHLKDSNLVGGKNQLALHTFYEQLKNQEEINRFVDTFRDLSEQQNRMGLIANGILSSPENPTITNLYSSLVIPMTWTCAFRCRIEDRDRMLLTINNLIEKLRGRKCDVALLNTTDQFGNSIQVPFKVGTMGQNQGANELKDGDYLGYAFYPTAPLPTFTTLDDLLTSINSVIGLPTSGEHWYYFEKRGGTLPQLAVLHFFYDAEQESMDYEVVSNSDTIVVPPTHSGLEKYKVSLSFDTIRCSEPQNLNEGEFVELSFSGSATIVNEKTKLGNDLVKISFSKQFIKASTDITFQNPTVHYLEPLEMPSGNNANTRLNQLLSNKMINNTHTDGLALSLQYTFILDETYPLLSQWFNYARYGTQGITESDISPNTTYEVKEIWSAWGVLTTKTFKAKIVESIDIENTESDALTLSLTMQIQGENT